MKRSRQSADDDGRVIADMSGIGRPSLMRGGAVSAGSPRARDADAREGAPKRPEDVPTAREMRKLIAGALGATMLVGAVFLICAALFILFCTQVWFR